MHEKRYRTVASCQASCSFDPDMQVVLRARNTCLSLHLAVVIRACEGVVQIRARSPLARCSARVSGVEMSSDDIQEAFAEAAPSMIPF
jgi:hypothetical protein